MATIKAIDGRSVHQIQSGQVIIDLCSVVKELVENSFDAGATSVEVKFKNQGLDMIEVQDNGSGIAPDNFETVALKHYTSKLSTYADLDTLETFGFRGEALASLCALSKFTITTCLPSDVPKGSKLGFDMTGKLTGRGVVASQKGTTVAVEKLFHNLPVRRRELERNIKREWGKVIALLNQYACIRTGVKFTVSQQPNRGKRIVMFSTKGNPSTRENLINVFGAKTLTCLIPLDLKLEIEPTTRGPRYLMSKKPSDGADGMTTEVKIVGHVSRPSPGEGRNTPDRQMFYVNGRPCGLPQFAKIFNETYRSYAPSQSPFIFADIKLDTHLYDVNVSPDKRTILLHDQGKMLSSLRDALVDLFESQTQTVPVSQPKLSRHLTPFKKPGIFSKDFPATGGAMSSSLARTPLSRDTSTNAKEGGCGDDEDDATHVASIRQFTSGTFPNTNMNNKPLSTTYSSHLAHKKAVSSPEDPKDISDKSSAPSKPSEDDVTPVYGADSNANEEEKSEKEASAESPEEAEEDVPEPPAENLEPKKPHPSPLPIRSDKDFVRLQASQTPQRIKDFHARLAEMRNHTGSLYQQNEEEGEARSSSSPQPPPIPSVSPQGKQQVSGSSGGAYSCMSRAPKRPTQEVPASITIGDSTVTTMIGSQAKRLKLGDSSTQAKPVKKKKKPLSSTAPLPSFGGRLSQMFAAAAAKPAADSGSLRATRGASEDAEEDEEAGSEMDVDEEEGKRETNDGDDEIEESDDDSLFVSDRRNRPRDVPMEIDESEEPPSPPLNAQSPHEDESHIDEDVDDGEEEEEVVEDLPLPGNSSDEADDFIPDELKKQKEEARVEQLIAQAEATSASALDADSNEFALKRGESLTKPARNAQRKKNSTVHLVQKVKTDEDEVMALMDTMNESLGMMPEDYHARRRQRELAEDLNNGTKVRDDDNDEVEGEAKLDSLIIDKSDFEKMKIVGQFNLGFIIALRQGEKEDPIAISSASRSSNPDFPSTIQSVATQKIPNKRTEDDLFIIDQHASDEKYNFERLQSSTIVASQRLVNPKQLDLTALEEEIILSNIPALEANGFQVHVDASGDVPVGRRVQLLCLPLSKEVTFGVDDFEELVALLEESGGVLDGAYESNSQGSLGPLDTRSEGEDEKANEPVGNKKDTLDPSLLHKIPRPSKVRKMFAMRACRSSVMIGRALTKGQMTKLVRQMGGMDKPWNCPHGRPTMRHLTGLGAWERRVSELDEEGWYGDGSDRDGYGGYGEKVDWGLYWRRIQRENEKERRGNGR
ncbi:hypothetical protein MKZ38_008000 [Zalerion maritima]|uniref:PMS1 n=1 Tax=Zalerion maritima TaxID=339359 RepID=A0AAD5RUG3_9PEZI|nr:hypothetical protein MKZ38_008000 [Zalerion maritima]